MKNKKSKRKVTILNMNRKNISALRSILNMNMNVLTKKNEYEYELFEKKEKNPAYYSDEDCIF